MTASQTYAIPEEDRAAFFRDLPTTHQLEIAELLQLFWAIDHTPHRERLAAWDAELKRANACLAARGIPRRFTRQTCYALRKAFTDAGNDWTVLIDRRRVPGWDESERRDMAHGQATHPDFLSYFRGLAQRQNRSSEQAIEELYRQWRAGEDVPGYGVWPSWFARTYPTQPMPAQAPLPTGWSRSRLRQLLPTAVELAGARRGRAAALAHLPDLIRTRDGLLPMQHIVLDDWRSDFLTYVPGIRQAVELHGILGMDVSCALPLAYGLRPALPREDGSHEGLKRIDTRSLVADILLRYGYPLDYQMTFIVENGTATITPADAAAIELVTNGQVKVRWTSMISGRVFGWEDRPVGNFKGKAWLESFFNLLHNAAGNITGQIGAHYEKRPRSIEARASELRALVRAEQAIPAHLRETINYRMPFTTLPSARDALDFVFHFLANREHHRCEGFESVLKVRLTRADPWRAVSDLVAAGQRRDALLALGPRPMLETPAERWNRLTRDVRFARLEMPALPLLLAEHRAVTVESPGEINLGSKSHPRVYRDRKSAYLEQGRKYLAWISTTDDSWCHLTDGRRYVCSVPRAQALSVADAAAVHAEIAAKQGQLKRVVASIQANNLDAPQRIADLDANLAAAQAQLDAQRCLLVPSVAASTVPVAGAGADILAAEDAVASASAVRSSRDIELADLQSGRDESVSDYLARRSALQPA
jgi:hypothetical protein